MQIPSTYDLEALRRDLARVEQEIKIFSDKVAELEERKTQLLKIIEAVEEYQKRKEGINHANKL